MTTLEQKVSVRLRPYQAEVARAVLDSVFHRRGLTFTVEMARQSGKNEVSAHLEMLLLCLFAGRGGDLVKAAPTFVPQAQTSIQRLVSRLREAGVEGLWAVEQGYIVRVGRARGLFFSADRSSHVVGQTAHLLLEVDEAQDVPPEKFDRDFRPMGAATNVTTVLYGTAWASDSLLEQVKAQNLELERRDGVRRHFRFDWHAVAAHNPLYARYVEAERQRLGEGHPLFRTQYALESLGGAGGLFSPSQRAQLQGTHLRRRSPEPGKTYVAGLDVAGGPVGSGELEWGGTPERGRDSTVLTMILELSGNPIAVLENVDQAQDIAVRPGAVWELPEKARAYLLDLLQGGGVKLHVDFIDVVYRALHDLAEAPRTAFGENRQALSGVALEMELHPLMQKVKRKRLIRSAAYRRRNEMALRILEQHTGADYRPYRTQVLWGPVLPQDSERVAQEEVALVQAGIHSRRTAMERLGIESAEAEWERVRGEGG